MKVVEIDFPTKPGPLLPSEAGGYRGVENKSWLTFAGRIKEDGL